MSIIAITCLSAMGDLEWVAFTGDLGLVNSIHRADCTSEAITFTVKNVTSKLGPRCKKTCRPNQGLAGNRRRGPAQRDRSVADGR